MKQSFLLSALVMCTTFCFWGCSNEENEFVISSEKITGVEQNGNQSRQHYSTY